MATNPPSNPSLSKAQKGGLAALVGLVGIGTASALITDTKQDEGVKYRSYKDSLTPTVIWTICSGTTRGVKANQTATPEECDAMTADDLIIAVKGVEYCSPGLKDPARREQLRAVVRLSNNIGVPSFCKGWFRSRPSVATLINENQWCAAGHEILRYDLIHGRPVRGLTNRRQRESSMFMRTLQCPAGGL